MSSRLSAAWVASSICDLLLSRPAGDVEPAAGGLEHPIGNVENRMDGVFLFVCEGFGGHKHGVEEEANFFDLIDDVEKFARRVGVGGKVDGRVHCAAPSPRATASIAFAALSFASASSCCPASISARIS